MSGAVQPHSMGRNQFIQGKESMSNQQNEAGSGIAPISPASGPRAGGTAVTINGTGFAGAEKVFFGGVPADAFSVNAAGTVITTTTPQGNAAGSVDVQVSTTTGLVSVGDFSYIASAVTGLSVKQGPLGGGTSVVVTGLYLTGATQVLFGGVPAPTFLVRADGTQIATTSPAGASAAAVDVQVALPLGETVAVAADKFTYIAPAVTGLSTTSGPLTGGTPVTILGWGFTGAEQVMFGGVPVSAPSAGGPAFTVNAAGTQISTISPPAPGTVAGVVDVQVSMPGGLTPKTAADAFTYFVPAPVNALFVIDNKTGVPDDLVHVKFLGAELNADALVQTYGDAKPLATGTKTNSQSYSLTDMTSTVPDAAGLPSPVPVFRINDYSGGRIYFSLGAELQSTTIPAAQNPLDHDFNTVYGYVEPSVFPAVTAGNTNLDASYVDFIGIPMDISIRKRADGSLMQPPMNNPLSTPAGMTVFDALTADAEVPAGTQVAAITTATSTSGQTVTIGGTARILSPSMYQASMIADASAYHDWSALLTALTAVKTSLSVASYTTVDTGGNLPKGTLFGFAGSKASNIAAVWAEKQGYALTAQAVADLNPAGVNPRIPLLKGVAGIKLSTNGTAAPASSTSVGNFDIYLTNTDLNTQTGIYGANPPYIVDWLDAPAGATAYPQASIENDLAGRVVGDLLAGFNFGWAGCATTVAVHAKATSTSANLTGTVFDANTGTLANTPIGQLSTGEFFYLLSLQPNTKDLAQWFGQSIQPARPHDYNNYASDFQALTNAYNMAFTDRLQGPSDPDMFFAPSEETYVHITLWPGAYTVTVTPPA